MLVLWDNKELKKYIVPLLQEALKPREVVRTFAYTTQWQRSGGWYPCVKEFPKEQLASYSGHIILQYADKTWAVCDVRNGVKEGYYSRWTGDEFERDNPLKRGGQLEGGYYTNDKRDKGWEYSWRLIGETQPSEKVRVTYTNEKITQAWTPSVRQGKEIILNEAEIQEINDQLFTKTICKRQSRSNPKDPNSHE